MSNHRLLRGAALSALTLMLAAACGNGDLGPGAGTGETDPDGKDPTTWNPSGETGECNVDALLEPYSYAAKVKTLLTGLALDEAELTAVEEDPSALADLIDGWIDTPEGEKVLERFFMTAFQQNNLDVESFFYLMGRAANNTGFFAGPPRSPFVHEMLNQNMEESFARTSVELIKQGRPFTEVITTDTFMMTTAQLVYMSYIDDDQVDDDGRRNTRTSDGDFPTLRIVTTPGAAPPPEQALDPNHANFGRFYHARIGELEASCNVANTNIINTGSFTSGDWRIANGGFSPSHWVVQAMFGRHETLSRHQAGCNTGARSTEPLLQRSDFNDWRMVTISQPADGESAQKFYNLPQLRNASEVKLHTYRKGFFSTPGFHGTWPNNEDNAARVTINQILIVALAQSFEGDAVTDLTPNGLDAEHAEDPECKSCHVALDPMRDFSRATFTNFYGEQLDEERFDLPGTFNFRGVEQTGNGLDDLGQILATHPDFPYAWAQKLCFFANSEACPEGDELDRIAAAFTESGFDFRVLLRELFASPYVTGSECLDGVDAGTTATISRRGQFCDQLSHRLGVEDLCSERTHFRDADNLQDDMSAAVASVPEDAFSRAEIAPVVIGETSLFTRANREAACTVAAQDGFDVFFTDPTIDTVVSTLVEQVMGLNPADPRHEGARGILTDHIDELLLAEHEEDVALKSAFVLACMAPTSSGVGF